MYHHVYIFFFFNDTATTEIYTLSLHDALPIYQPVQRLSIGGAEILVDGEPAGLTLAQLAAVKPTDNGGYRLDVSVRSEEHTSELQSQSNLVCRLLLEKKKKNIQKFDFNDSSYS